MSAPDRTGFGTTLIERVLARETGGKAVIDYAPGGVKLTVDVPMLGDDGDGAPLE